MSSERVVKLCPRSESRPLKISMEEFVYSLRYRQEWIVRRHLDVHEDHVYVTDTVDLNKMPSHRKVLIPLNPEDMYVVARRTI